MIEKWKRALDKKHLAGTLTTDLSKAFDCLNHELLFAKLDAYGFNQESLLYIFSYLSGRKTKNKGKKFVHQLVKHNFGYSTRINPLVRYYLIYT